MADAKLVVIQGAAEGHEFDLEGILIVGRDQSAAITLPDPEISRQHLQVTTEGRQVTVEDLRSTNGTFVNDERVVPGELTLADGDRIRMGTTVVELRVAEAPPEPEPAEVGDAAAVVPEPGGPAAPDAPEGEPGFADRGSASPQEPDAGGGEAEGEPEAEAEPEPDPPPAKPPPAKPLPAKPAVPVAKVESLPAAAPAAVAQAPSFPSADPDLFGPPVPATELARWGPRAGAAAVDGVICLLLAVTVIGPILYMTLTTARKGEANGQTLGKQLFDIAAIRDDRLPFDFRSAFVREFLVKNLLFGVAMFVFTLGIGWLLDNLWPLWDDEAQALHDKVVSTHVIAA